MASLRLGSSGDESSLAQAQEDLREKINQTRIYDGLVHFCQTLPSGGDKNYRYLTKALKFLCKPINQASGSSVYDILTIENFCNKVLSKLNPVSRLLTTSEASAITLDTRMMDV